ncbi:MAG: GIY-YIG nuclease family protein [Ignavibacteriae bacterium]|nr:GIY-YIG nuclease family protein [Ignavibacteriota bacterium]MCB9216163.1 GIY-YIG nuclease family protein [Ignavibacteria bacterium]
MFSVYILQSESTGTYYVGQTQDVHKRLLRHNAGGSPSTRAARPWTLKYHKEFTTRSEAVKAERYIKRQKSHQFIQKVIEEGLQIVRGSRHPDAIGT